MLKVPFVKQINKNSCGAAALEMVYKYYGLKKIDQKEIFDRLKTQDLEDPNIFNIATEDLVKDAKEKGFEAFWKRVDYHNIKKSIQLLKQFIDKNIPIIVCQQYTKDEPLMGHFRVVFRVDDKSVYFHDSHPKTGGSSIKWTHKKFIDFWQPTGNNVTGGVYIIIKKYVKTQTL